MNSSAPTANAARSVEDGRDFEFTAQDFRRVRELIHSHAGISLAASKNEMVYSRLARRLRELRIDSFDAYLNHLEGSGNEAEWEHFTNALTTNLTSFFREAHHFPTLVEHVRGLRRDRPLRIWSCAASTGEEPYSIGIAVAEAFGTLTPSLQILATDVDTKVLAVARAGVYDESRITDLPVEMQRKFFLRGRGAHAGKVRVRPELASLVRFKALNLLAEDWLKMPPVDAIFCRNVMIYFDKPTQYGVLRKLASRLEQDGLLFAGHSESLSFAADLFKHRAQTVYERAAAAGGAAR